MYKKGKRLNRKKRQNLKLCLIIRFIKTNTFWHVFCKLALQDENFPDDFFFSPVSSNMLKWVFEGSQLENLEKNYNIYIGT